MKVFGENAVGREGWRGVGVGGEAVRLSPKYWEKLNGMMILECKDQDLYHAAVQVWRRVRVGARLGYAFVFESHAHLEEFGNMLIRSIKNRNQRREGKQIWARWCNVLYVCVYARVLADVCASLWMHARSHITDPYCTGDPCTALYTVYDMY